jgi:hypothetical protein
MEMKVEMESAFKEIRLIAFANLKKLVLNAIKRDGLLGARV